MARSSPTNSRIDGRTSLFAAATLHSGSQCLPVRIRNISRVGALIEAPTLPPAGGKVRLCRARLSIRGQVVWTTKGRAGLQFDSPADVASWIRSCSTKGDGFAAQSGMASVPPFGSGNFDEQHQVVLPDELLRTLNQLERVHEKLSVPGVLPISHATEMDQLGQSILTLRGIFLALEYGEK